MMTQKKKLEIRSQSEDAYILHSPRPVPIARLRFHSRGVAHRTSRRHVPQDQPWPTRQKRILCVGWAPPDLRYVTKKEIQLRGGGTVELTVLDSSSPKLTDPPEGRLCKL